jgi:hypothetical protein
VSDEPQPAPRGGPAEVAQEGQASEAGTSESSAIPADAVTSPAATPVDPAPAGTPVEPPPAPAPAYEPLASPDGAAGTSVSAERPEVAVGAAFAGGFLLALILKRLAR